MWVGGFWGMADFFCVFIAIVGESELKLWMYNV